MPALGKKRPTDTAGSRADDLEELLRECDSTVCMRVCVCVCVFIHIHIWGWVRVHKSRRVEATKSVSVSPPGASSPPVQHAGGSVRRGVYPLPTAPCTLLRLHTLARSDSTVQPTLAARHDLYRRHTTHHTDCRVPWGLHQRAPTPTVSEGVRAGIIRGKPRLRTRTSTSESSGQIQAIQVSSVRRQAEGLIDTGLSRMLQRDPSLLQ